jgi:hypothetical protein
MLLPAPGRLSTKTLVAQISLNFAATIRATISTVPLAANPTITRTGLLG